MGYNKRSTALKVVKILLKKDAKIKTQEQVFKILKHSMELKKGILEEDILEVVKRSISQSQIPFNVNHQDEKGNTALSLAYENKKFDVIEFLIEKGADLKTIILSTGKSFMIHVIEDNLFHLAPSLKFDIILENGFTPLTAAILSGNYGSFITLIEKHKADVNFSDEHGRKPIHYAAVGGSTEIVKYLLNYGAYVRELGGTGNTALHYAAMGKDNNENIAFLIDKGIDVNCENNDGIRPIRCAIANNRFANFQTLLDNDASLEMKDFEGVKVLI